MSLLHQDVDFKLLLMRASIWKQGRAASIVATGQLCCSTPSKLGQEHPWATVGWLWDKMVVAALASSPLPQSCVCPLSHGGTLGHVVFWSWTGGFHATFSPTLSLAHPSMVQEGCLVLTRTMKTGQESPWMNAACHSTEITLAGTCRYLKVCSFTAGFLDDPLSSDKMTNSFTCKLLS